MSAPRAADGIAPLHRQNLPRQRKNLRLEMRLSVYEILRSEMREGESTVATVERLVLKASRREYVHIPRNHRPRVA
jgi:hypothetical protein